MREPRPRAPAPGACVRPRPGRPGRREPRAPRAPARAYTLRRLHPPGARGGTGPRARPPGPGRAAPPGPGTRADHAHPDTGPPRRPVRRRARPRTERNRPARHGPRTCRWFGGVPVLAVRPAIRGSVASVLSETRWSSLGMRAQASAPARDLCRGPVVRWRIRVRPRWRGGVSVSVPGGACVRRVRGRARSAGPAPWLRAPAGTGSCVPPASGTGAPRDLCRGPVVRWRIRVRPRWRVRPPCPWPGAIGRSRTVAARPGRYGELCAARLRHRGSA